MRSQPNLESHTGAVFFRGTYPPEHSEMAPQWSLKRPVFLKKETNMAETGTKLANDLINHVGEVYTENDIRGEILDTIADREVYTMSAAECYDLALAWHKKYLNSLRNNILAERYCDATGIGSGLSYDEISQRIRDDV